MCQSTQASLYQLCAFSSNVPHFSQFVNYKLKEKRIKNLFSKNWKIRILLLLLLTERKRNQLCSLMIQLSVNMTSSYLNCFLMFFQHNIKIQYLGIPRKILRIFRRIDLELEPKHETRKGHEKCKHNNDAILITSSASLLCLQYL